MNFCTEIIGFSNVTKTKKNIYIKIKMQQKKGEKKKFYDIWTSEY